MKFHESLLGVVKHQLTPYLKKMEADGNLPPHLEKVSTQAPANSLKKVHEGYGWWLGRAKQENSCSLHLGKPCFNERM